MRCEKMFILLVASVLGCAAISEAAPVTANFTLLQSESYAGKKPSGSYPVYGDWLVGTDDDQSNSSIFNPQGAVSHNLADILGTPGSGFHVAPSLTGSLTLQFTSSTPGHWDVSATDLAYNGVAAPGMTMNQYLIAPGSAATQTPKYLVDGLGNNGTWQGQAAANWAIQYDLDFYFSVGGMGISATFNDKSLRGYLIPVSQLTAAGMAAVNLDDPTGYFSGDFESYLLNVVAPMLPGEATYVLVTQMDKTHPDFAQSGLPITTNSLIGNTTIAYTTAVVPEPTTAVMFALIGLASRGASRRHRTT